MKTPFVAHAPSILVIHAREEIATVCKEAARSIGMPVRVVAELGEAATVVHDTRPLVLVCDAAAGIGDASVAADLAGAIDAVVVQLDVGEAPAAVTHKLQTACIAAEKARHERRA